MSALTEICCTALKEADVCLEGNPPPENPQRSGNSITLSQTERHLVCFWADDVTLTSVSVMYNKQILLVLVWSTGLSYGFSFTVTTLSNQDGSSPESFLKVSVCSALRTSVTSDWTSVVWSLYVLFALFMVFAFSCVRSCFTLLQVKTQHFLTLLLHNKGFKYLNN